MFRQGLPYWSYIMETIIFITQLFFMYSETIRES